MSDYSNKLIYGKNALERIVSMEITDDVCTLFRELEDGSLNIMKVPHKFWILSNKARGSGWHRLDGDQYFKFGKQYKTFKEYIEDKKKLPYKEIYTISNQNEAMMVKDGLSFFKGMKHSEVSILSFDIETTGLDHNNDSKIICISNTYRNSKGQITKKLFTYENYENCAEMIDDWSAWVQAVDPSIMCGHNIYAYDLPYLQFCHSKYSDKGIKLGRLDEPVHFSTYDSKYRVDGSRDLHYKKVHVYGRQLVDTMFLAYKYDAVEKKYESYSLKKIIAQEGLEKADRVFYDAGQIRNNYMIPEEFERIKEYCKDDSDDSLSLYDLMVPAQFYLTQSIPKPFQLVIESATGSQINSLLVRAYLQDKRSVAKAEDLSVPEVSEDEEDDEDGKVEGGISFAVPGIYKNVFKVDIKSCYPSQILRFKLYDGEKDPEAYFYKLVEHFTLQRYQYKELHRETNDIYYKNLDAMAKIFINSSYGVTNTGGLNYNSSAVARKITLESRTIIDMSLRWASGFGYNHWITKFYDAVNQKPEKRIYLSLSEDELPIKYQHNFIIAPSDTDSISFCKSDMSEFSPEELKTLLKEINEQSPDKVLWEDDGYYKTIIALKAKNYVMYDPSAKAGKKKLTIKGSALKGSTKSEALKEFTKKVIDTMVYTEKVAEINPSLQKVYNKYVSEIMNITEIKRWSARKTLSSTMQNSTRANETKVMDALIGSDYREGDRFYVYYKPDDSLSLSENFDGIYNKSRLLKNLYDTVKIFGNVLPIKDLFTNYSLVKNYKTLDNSPQ